MQADQPAHDNVGDQSLPGAAVAAVRLVLLRPQTSENLGAAARAMKNFGLKNWVWVAPAVDDLGPARRMAVHAGELLDAARIQPTLADAVAGCVWVVGTSSRRLSGVRRLTPRAAAEGLLERAAQGPVALVFGDERHGLTNAEIARCHALSAVLTSPEQPSINLAQAILLYAYELRLAALKRSGRYSGDLPAAATTDDLEAVRQALRRLLAHGGFLRGPERHAVQNLLAPLNRARLTRREARLWLAALRSLDRTLAQEGSIQRDA